MIMLTFIVYLQFRQESYNCVTFSLQHSISTAIILLFYIAFFLTLSLTTDRCLLSTT